MNLYPTDRTRGERKALKQEVRNELGTSREGAPSLGRLMVAAEKLAKLVRLTTNGAYRLRLERVRNGGEWAEPDSVTKLEDMKGWSE